MYPGLYVPPTVLACIAAAFGWWVGLGSAWLNDRVLQLDGRRGNRGSMLVRDPLVQGGVAAGWALLALSAKFSWSTVAAGLLAVPLIQVAITDVRHRYVYSLVAGVGLAVCMALSPAVHAASPWTGVAGAVAGLAGMALVREVGRLAYGDVTMGRGDLIVAAMVGAAAGPEAIVALASGLVISGVVGLVVLLVRGRSRAGLIPYGAGMCLAGLACLIAR